MKVCWISAGVSSFIAGYLVKDTVDEFIYTHIDNQHPDSLRFIKDCEKVLGKKITILQSQYKSVDNVIKTFGFINGPYGAKCTDILKKRVRKEWEYGKKDLTYVWGFDCSKRERAKKINGAIISADSMQIYKHMDIGSAKIMPDEMENIPHYLVDELEPDEEFNIVRFQQMAKDALEEIYANNKTPIIQMV